jgi:hypothetical protein
MVSYFVRSGIVLLVVAVPTWARAVEAEPDQVFTDPSKAGADIAVQGEYVGELTKGTRLGVQVIALGEGKFHAVTYLGGLPGDGWDREHTWEGDGEAKDGVCQFQSDKGSGRIQAGVLSLSDADGNPVGELKRLERASVTLGKQAPEGAVVLFDGESAGNFAGGHLTEDGLLMQGATSVRKFGDCTLHLEFRTPFMPAARGQARGNSGCYLQGRYEVQVLDSFGLKGSNNECGGIYSIRDPDQNMCYPPLAWQTYDIDYTAARYDGDVKISPAEMTVRHNGVIVHEKVELPHATTAAPVAEGPDKGPLFLQDHGNPVRFRNIWLIER